MATAQAMKFAQLPDLATLPADAGLVVTYNGLDYLIRISTLQGLVSKEALGLDQVDNTSDVAKPISQATATALAGKAASNHNHDINTLTGVVELLAGYALVNHTQAINTITGLQLVLDSKAALQHNHLITEVTGLQTALDGKAPTVHQHAMADVIGLVSNLQAMVANINNKANVNHSHSSNDIGDFQQRVVQILADQGIGESPVAIGDMDW